MAIANPTGNDLLAMAGRFLFASLFVASGVNKLLWPLATIEYARTFGLPVPQLWCIGTMLLELACATLLILGYRTRAVAWMLAAYCVSTAIIFHHAFADQNQLIQFLTNLAMAGGLLALSIYGAGLFSIDRLVGNGHVETASNYARITPSDS
ncbi:DoxX family protein [Paraburkholderia sp. J10-1]|uniref:DoxX family protein n=1 Tax=Paraburkholderia sp. J10-1 TaxID=2805430 RepID=UPI002AB6193C|nr:DoxX family protein [Paraburkholderia sp. J10-1]